MSPQPIRVAPGLWRPMVGLLGPNRMSPFILKSFDLNLNGLSKQLMSLDHEEILKFATLFKFSGTQRLRYAYINPKDDEETKAKSAIENMIAAIKNLVSDEAADTTRRILAVTTRHLVKNNIPRTCSAYAYCLKKSTAELGSLSEIYSLFNRIEPINEQEVFEKLLNSRVNKWLFKESEANPRIRARIKQQFTLKRAIGGTIDDFIVNRDLWATPGAIDLPVNSPFNHTKAGFAYSMTDKELREYYHAHEHEQPIWRVFVKRDEIAGSRTIVLTDFITHVKLSFLLYYVEGQLANSEHYYNYWTGTKRLQHINSVRELLAKGWWSIATDQSGFDESIHKQYIDDVVSILVDGVVMTDQTSKESIATLRWQLSNALIEDPITQIATEGMTQIQKRKWLIENNRVLLNGLASGLRITTLVNSVVNTALQTEILEALNILYAELVALGDDSRSLSAMKPDLLAMADEAKLLGFTLNMRKSKISKFESEFLKQTTTPLFTAGDPIRALRALLFGSSELERDHATPIMKQRAGLWAKFIVRMQLPWDLFFDAMYFDYSHAVRKPMSKQEYKVWLSTASPYGGGGFDLTATHSYREKQTTETIRTPPNNVTPPRVLDTDTWRRGLSARLRSVSRKQPQIQTVEIEKVLLSKQRFTSSALLIMSQVYRLPKLPMQAHDAISNVIKGIRSKKDMMLVLPQIAKISIHYSSVLLSMYNSMGWRNALSVASSTIASGTTSPAISFALGESTAELFSDIILNTALFLAPRRQLRERMPSLLTSVQRTLVYNALQAY